MQERNKALSKRSLEIAVKSHFWRRLLRHRDYSLRGASLWHILARTCRGLNVVTSSSGLGSGLMCSCGSAPAPFSKSCGTTFRYLQRTLLVNVLVHAMTVHAMTVRSVGKHVWAPNTSFCPQCVDAVVSIEATHGFLLIAFCLGESPQVKAYREILSLSQVIEST